MTKKIIVGILGAGQPNIATNQQMPACLKSELVELKALCDRLETVHDFAEQTGVKAYTEYIEMLADPNIDMIQVATPDQFHCEHALMALEAGKHVLLQKPPCLNRDELQKLRDASRKSKGRLKIMLHQRHTTLSRSINKYIKDGIIGEVREIIIKFRGRRFPIENPNSFYLKKESGGVWLHNTMHWLDEAVLYSNIIPEKINLFSTKNKNGIPECLGEGPNYWSAIFPMKKITFLFEYNTMLMKEGMPSGMQRTIIGTKGEIRQNYGSEDLFLYKKGSEEIKKLPLLNPELKGLDDMINAFNYAIDDFSKEIITGKECNPRIEDSLNLFELILKGVENE
ncbi:MAG: Gfo/Idh/MocA family oxidoreductase [Verrucomicrobiota bacterium]|nr:Gfo/Idh/MocA family oxidoreductase [Verrucomicrobiota bacterium]